MEGFIGEIRNILAMIIGHSKDVCYKNLATNVSRH